MYSLKPSTASKRGQGCMMLFALFWLSFSILWTVLAWRGGGAMALFGVPFIAIGVALIGGLLWRRIAGVKIAPPVLSVSKPDPLLGENIRLKWELRFRAKTVLQEGKVELVFRESATYSQGTDTRTDTFETVREFFELPIGEMAAGHVVQGQADFIIPVDGMHSFKAPNNRLDWLIRIRLNAMEWPDVIEEYALSVQPQKAWGQ